MERIRTITTTIQMLSVLTIFGGGSWALDSRHGDRVVGTSDILVIVLWSSSDYPVPTIKYNVESNTS
jgi:hypothetical protein